MSALSPFMPGKFPQKPLRFMAPLRGEKVDSVPAGGEYLGLEQFEPWTGKLSGVQLEQQPEGGANVFKPGDVLFGKLRPYLAKSWAADRDGFCTAESLVLCPLDSDPRFIRYCLLTPEFVDTVNGSTYGSKMPRADWSFIGSVQVPCPLRVEQERIANFLDEHTLRIDALISEKWKLLESLQQYAHAEISRLLSYGVLGAARRQTGNPFVPDAPVHWRVAAFKRALLGMSQGWSPQCENRQAESTEWGVLKVGCVNGNSFNPAENKALPPELQPDLSCVLRLGDVLVSRANTRELVGLAALVEADYPNLLLCDKLYRLNLNSNLVTAEFAVLALRAEASRRQIELGANGASSSMQNISQDVLRDLIVAFPPLTEQVEIVKKAQAVRSAVDELSAHVRDHIDRLKEYRASLISASVTGQLDLVAFKEAA